MDAFLGGSENTPEDVREFIKNVNADDVDWVSEALRSGAFADTLPKDEDHITSDFRVRIYVIKIFRSHSKHFVDLIAHEMEHVRRFRCGEESPHHPTNTERRAYDERGKTTGDYIRLRSKTLTLFEAWIAHLQDKADPEKLVATAAANALAGERPGGNE